MVVFLPWQTKVFTTKVYVFNFHGLNVLLVWKPLICCAGTERISQSISDCCFNSTQSCCNMVARLTYASHTCTVARSNFTRFLHNNPKFMIYLVYSLRLYTFSFENAVFISRQFVKIYRAEANQVYSNYKLSSFYNHLNQCCQSV